MKKRLIYSILIVMLSVFCMGLISCKKTPQNAPEIVIVVVDTIDITVGDEITLEAYVLDDGVKTTDGITYQTTNSEIVSVTESGVLLGKQIGTATISVLYGNQRKDCSVNVVDTEYVPYLEVDCSADGIKLFKGDSFTLNTKLKFKGKTVDGAFGYSVADDAVLTVSKDGTIKALSAGKTEITVSTNYLIWKNITSTFTVEVVENVRVVLSKSKVELSNGTLLGGATECAVSVVRVLADEQEVSSPEIIWASQDEMIAQVENGVIKAQGVGKTTVTATYKHTDGEDYTAYILVSIEQMRLATPENIALSKDYEITWDAVEGASSYLVTDGTSEVVVEEANWLVGAKTYYGEKTFMITALSSEMDVENSFTAEFACTFEKKSLLDEALTLDAHEATSISKLFDDDFTEDGSVYYAKVSDSTLTGGVEQFGYTFKKVLYTANAYSVFGAQGSHGKWCKNALLESDQASKYVNSKITFWAFAEKETTFYYWNMDMYWTRQSLGKQTIPANTWTKVTFTIASNDFPYITCISTTGNFYFLDICISQPLYETNDYSDLSATQAGLVVTLIDDIGTVTSDSGEKIELALNAYNDLPELFRSSVTNYSVLVSAIEEFSGLVSAEMQNDAGAKAVSEQISVFVDSYAGITPDTYQALLDTTGEIDAAYSALSYKQKMGVTNYGDYENTLKKFYVIEGMTSGARNNFAKLNGTNGFVNLTSWQDMNVAALTEAANAYGGVATIGANAQTDIIFYYTERDSLDLSGYTHVTFAVRNGKSTPMSVYLYKTTGGWSREICLATGIEKATSNIDFTTIVMTVEQFQNYYIDFYYETTATGNIWITPIIAFTIEETTENVMSLIDAIGTVTETSAEKIESARNAYDSLSVGQRTYVNNYEILLQAERVFKVIDAIVSIGTVTEANADKVEQARKLYDELSEVEQALIVNYESLLQAEDELRTLSEALKNDTDVLAMVDAFENFIDGFTTVSVETYAEILSDIVALEEQYTELSYVKRLCVSNYEDYQNTLKKFYVIDGMTSGAGSNFAKLNGTNGFVNLTSWQDISAAALTEAANAYGGAATIGANAQTDIVFHYTARADLDLSGYTHVTFAVRNGKSTPMSVYLYNTVGAWGRRDCLASGIATATSNTDFTTIVMTVEQFQNYYIDCCYETTAAGNIWITPMIAVIATQETQNVIALIAALDGTETKVTAARTAYNGLSEAEKAYVSNYAELVAAEKILASSEEDVQALIAQITTFNTKFASTSPEYYNALSADIAAIDAAYEGLSTVLQSGVENYDAYLANKNSFCVIEDMSTGLADRITIGGGAFSAKTPYNGNSTLTTYAAIYGGVGSFGLTQNAVVWRWSNRDTLDLSGYTYVTFTIRHNLANGLKIRLLDKSSWSETKVIQENLASSTASTSTPFTVITMTVEEYKSSLISFVQPTTAQGNIWMSSFIAHN